MANSRRDAMARNRAVEGERRKIESFVAMPYGGLPEDEQFLSDSYYGDGGYKDGSYVVPHPRETPLKYGRRKLLAYYFNYVKPCVDGNVNPIFKELPVRSYKTGSPYFEGFLADCDLKGTSLDQFIKNAALEAKLYGLCAVFVDNFGGEELSQLSRMEAEQKRRYPYVYTLKNSQIKEYAYDHTGKLTSLTFDERRKGEDGEERQITWTWTLETIRRQAEGEAEQLMENKLGRIPIVLLYGAKPRKGELKPTSGFYQVAKANLALYNACSELRELLRSQAFNILTYGIGEEDDYDKVKEIVASTENVMVYRGNLNAPQYIAPSAAPAEMLLSEIKLLVEEIYRMAGLASVTGVQTEVSGAAKAWDFESTNTTLSEFAKSVEQAEKEIAQLFGAYTGAELEFTSKYSESFGIEDAGAELDEITKALGLMIGGIFDRELKKKAARVVFKNLDDAVINEVTDDIESRTDDELQVKAENIGAEGEA